MVTPVDISEGSLHEDLRGDHLVGDPDVKVRGDETRAQLRPASSEEVGAKTAQPPTALPAPELLGRDRDLAALREHLNQGVIITSGTEGAGIGATSLARRLATEVSEIYPGGVIEIDLQGGEPAYIAPMSHIEAQRYLLLSLDPETAPPEEPRELRRCYQAALADHKLLLILDNVTSATQIRYLLPRENSTAIITSEHDFSASFSKLFSWTLEGLTPQAAYNLMVSITPDAANLSRRALDRLTSRLDGVPLSLRLVAPLLGQRPRLAPHKLMRNLEQAEKRLVALRGSHTPDIAVDAAIEIAYELLADKLKPYYVALAVFSAPFTLAAAAAVWQRPAETALELLDRLVRVSLVDHQPGTAMYQIHHAIRRHAQELLLGQPERSRTLVSNYAGHYLKEALRMNARLRPNTKPAPEASTPLAFRMLWQHLPAAWRRVTGADPGWPAPASADRWISDFPLRVMPFLKTMLPREDLCDWLESALRASRRIDDLRTMSILLGALGKANQDRGENKQALRYYEEQLEIARERDDRYVEAEALMHIGMVCGATGDIRRAGTSWRKALVLLQLVGDRRAEHVENWLAELQQRIAA
jgi:tetratricopeptide (TPR) repeat protein